MNDKSYVVLHGWMLNQLDLHGNELVIYSLIYGFTQDGSWAKVSREYIADWLNTKRLATATEVVTRLVSKGLIEFNTEGKCRVTRRRLEPVSESGHGSTESEHKSAESEPYNTKYININKYTAKGCLLYGAPEELIDFVESWFEYKRQIGRPFNSAESEKACISKLIQSYGAYGISELQKAMDYSVGNGYAAFFFDRLGKGTKTSRAKPNSTASYDTSKFIKLSIKTK